jgi:predicted phage gp36 major capsid-like protein
VPGDGGYAVPHELDKAIARQLTDVSPIRQIAQVVQVGTSGYRKLMALGGTASGWASETAARPETATPKFEEIAPPAASSTPTRRRARRCSTTRRSTSRLAGERDRTEFGRAEGAAVRQRQRVNQPLGFLTSPGFAAARRDAAVRRAAVYRLGQRERARRHDRADADRTRHTLKAAPGKGRAG